MKSKFFARAMLGLILTAPVPLMALETVPQLDLETAQRMADACAVLAEAEGWSMNIAIVDRGADLVVFQRMDNAFLGSVEIAIGKAETSARFPFSTRTVAELGYGTTEAPAAVPGLVEVDDIIAFAGGLPIMTAGGQIGGVGVSGDTADNDEACAQAAIAAVSDELEVVD